MLLTLVEDYSKSVSLDSELLGASETGYYLNSGVHQFINIQNLLAHIPKVSFTFEAYNAATTYGSFTTTKQSSDIVEDAGQLYQSIASNNVGNALTDTAFWLPTDLNSIRLKTFWFRVYQSALQHLNLTRRLVDNQYLYNVVELNRQETETQLSGDFSGWCFEPKGSDYVSIRLNEVALQAKTATPQNLYVVNQGQLIDTLTLNPNADGRLVFERLDYTISGKGVFYFLIDSQVVLTNGSFVDPLQYKGFTAYTCTGIGDAPESAEYSYMTSNNGLSFNVSAVFDGAKYIENNIADFGKYLQSAWEYEVLNYFLYNPNNRSNRDERNTLDRQILMNETKLTNAETVVKQFMREKKKALSIIDKSFDNMLVEDDDGWEIEVGSV